MCGCGDIPSEKYATFVKLASFCKLNNVGNKHIYICFVKEILKRGLLGCDAV